MNMRVERTVFGAQWVGVLGGQRVGCGWALVVVMAVLVSGTGCEHLERVEEAGLSRAEALTSDEELGVVMSRLGARPRRIVSGADVIRIGIHFDPEMIDVRRVVSYRLWGRSSSSREWQRVREILPADLPVEMGFKEGTVGLRASARYHDGTELFVPQSGDDPAVWLVVDRSPPSLRWLKPAANWPVPAEKKVELVWTINEVETGDEPCELEWSGDRGGTWHLIAKVGPGSGHQSYRWKLPRELKDDFLVRVTARDLAGHADSSVLPLEFSPALPRGDAPASSAPVAGVATEPAGRALSTGPAFDSDPSRDPVVPGVSGERAGARAFVGPQGPLQFERVPPAVLAGGTSFEVRWSSGGIGNEAEIALEWSRNGGREWHPVGTSRVSAGAYNWEVPCVNETAALLRLRAKVPDGGPTVATMKRPFSIDCAPPKVWLPGLPEVVGARPLLNLRWTDAGAGLSGVTVFLRLGPSAAWQPLPRRKVRLDLHPDRFGEAMLLLNLDSVPESSYEIFLRATDAVGNRSDAPHAGSVEPALIFIPDIN